MHTLNIKSDWRNYFSYVAGNGDSMSELEIYQALAAISNSGTTIQSREKQLSFAAKKLLQIRRHIYQRDLGKAYDNLLALRTKDLHPMLEGDRHFLRGVLHSRQGNLRLTLKNMQLAKEVYRQNNLEHRFLRALANEKISLEDLSSYLNGDLYAIKQVCQSKGFYDIVGNIQKAYSVDLLERGLYKEAKVQAMDALESYKYDGCPEDRAVACCLVAITYHLYKDKVNAAKYIGLVLGKTGKINAYKQIYFDLENNKIPNPPKGHPLCKTKWPSAAIKEGTIPGMILTELKKGKITRDLLISKIWGEQLDSSSYIPRLHVAINKLRKQYKFNIKFDGTYYTLPNYS